MRAWWQRRKTASAALLQQLPALYMALRHKDTPSSARVFALLAVGYALSPIDLVPDFLPVLGYVDDILLLPMLVRASLRRIPPEVLAACRAQAADMWQEGRPKRWRYAWMVLLLWAAVLGLILCIVCR
nr:YkvA family protein [Maliibacterium massiliense]